jgi:hypothetical protein
VDAERLRSIAMKRSMMIAIVASLAMLSIGGRCTPKRDPKIFILTPANGAFHTTSPLNVTGRVQYAAGLTTLVNGVVVPVQPNGLWSTTVALNPAEIFQPIQADLRQGSTVEHRARVVVIRGDSTAEGAYSLGSVALRLNDLGLDSAEPVIKDLVPLDLTALLPVGEEVISGFCAIDSIFGCLGRVDVFIANPPPSFSGFGLDMDAMTDFVTGDVDVNDIRVDLDIDGSGLAPSCGVRVTANQVQILGDYGLDPDGVDPTTIDVNLLSTPGVSFTNFNDEFTSGLCDFPLIGPLIGLIIGDIQPTVTDGLRNFLDDPDGTGPLDAPIADSIELALAEISLAGPIGAALGLTLDAPFFDIFEDSDGVTLGSDSSFVADTGVCNPPAAAPNLTASLELPEAFPSFGPTTPAGGLPYGMGLCISSSAFNQLLKSQTECGLLTTSVFEADLGSGLETLTAGVLAGFIPQYSAYPPSTPMRVDVRPTIAPVVTGAAGPAGELTALEMANLVVEIRRDDTNLLTLGGRVDADLGMDVVFDDLSGELQFILATPTPEAVTVRIIENPLGVNVLALDFLLPNVLAELLPSLATDLAAFPLPQFLGLNLQGVEVSRQGAFISLFADLVSAP